MNRTDRIRAALPELQIPQELMAYLEKASPEDVFRVNLRQLEGRINVPVQTLLSVFLKLVQAGLFNLSWEYHCTHCNAIPDFKHSFGDLKSESFCPLCDLSFRNTLDQNVEVTFTAHPGFIEIPPEIPARLREEALQAVKEKRYRMPEKFLSGLQCLNNETFHELFGEQVLSSEESLGVETITFLFTDIKGSTQMYSDLGDAKSYEIVREHFKILFQAIADNGGLVIKTIGDAVMGSFLRPVQAVAAAVQVHNEFKKRQWSQIGYLQIKMGIHTGHAIVVNLNDSVDYFGNTVNLAARVQASVRNHDIRFTRRVLDDHEVVNFLKDRKAVLHKKFEMFKGINDPVEVYRYTPDEMHLHAGNPG